MSLEVSESNMQCSKLLSAKGLSRQLGERILWRNLTIELVKGDRVGLVAPSGSGKTLLMRNLSLLDPLEQGQLTLHGRAPAEWGLPMWRSHVIYLNQRPVSHSGTVKQNLQSILLWGNHRHRCQWQENRICSWLATLGRDADFLEFDAKRLSGGELQILALMRAMQLDPDLLLLDEPCASLDTTTTYGVEQLLHTWLETDKRACIFTSHDVGQIERFASRIQELIP